MKKRGNDAGDECDVSDGDQKDTDAEKRCRNIRRKKREKRTKGKKWGKRADAGGSAQSSTEDPEDRSITGEEQAEPRTAERKIYRGQRTRKLRKMNDGGKLEIVQVKTYWL